MTEKHRAKRKNIGEWRYGYPCFSDEGWFLIDEDAIAFTENLDELQVEFADTVLIDPASLSRCSGFIACGQEVYEGDIIRFHIDHTTEFWTAVVRFGWHDTYEYGWFLEPIRDTVFAKAIGVWLGENPAFGSTAVVVGNVWDNPELMEVQT
ncbi:MAG: hypothetical protein J6N32_09860 [Clostridia bacterium]|nr:hypothetical protein [Clostridia bacterium]